MAVHKEVIDEDKLQELCLDVTKRVIENHIQEKTEYQSCFHKTADLSSTQFGAFSQVQKKSRFTTRHTGRGSVST